MIKLFSGMIWKLFAWFVLIDAIFAKKLVATWNSLLHFNDIYNFLSIVCKIILIIFQSLKYQILSGKDDSAGSTKNQFQFFMIALCYVRRSLACEKNNWLMHLNAVHFMHLKAVKWKKIRNVFMIIQKGLTYSW